MSLSDFFSDHSSGIMTAVSIAGLTATVALAIKGTPEAYDAIMTAREDLPDARSEREAKAIKKQALKRVAKAYAPAAIAFGLTVGSELYDMHLDTSEKASLIAAAAVPTGYLVRYQREVRNEIGENKEYAIRQRLADEDAMSEECKNAKTYIVGDGDYQMYDSVIGKKFMGTQKMFNDAISWANIKMANNDEVTVGDLYAEMGVYNLPGDTDEKSWIIGEGAIKAFFDPGVDEFTGRPQLVISYNIGPKIREKRR